MLKISKLADYATVIMHWLSRHDAERFSAAAISEQVGIAMPTVSKLLKLLNNAELVTSTRGAHGGYHLSRSVEKISLADIISAVDGRPAMTECSHDSGHCQLDEQCELRGNWQHINKMIYQFLDQLSLRDMKGSLSDNDVVPMQFYPPEQFKENQYVCEK